MTSKVRNICLVAGILTIFPLMILTASGFSERQTTDILLNDQKFGKRALWKAKLHGESLLNELEENSESLGKLSAYNTRLLVEFLKSVNASASREFATNLSANEHFRARLVGIAVLAHGEREKTNPAHLNFLGQVVCGSLPGLDPRPAYSTDDVSIAIEVVAEFWKIDERCLKELIEKPGHSPAVVEAARQALRSR